MYYLKYRAMHEREECYEIDVSINDSIDLNNPRGDSIRQALVPDTVVHKPTDESAPISIH